MAAVRAQCITLFGKLYSKGPAAVLAAGRRRRAMDLERIWVKQMGADAFVAKQGYNILRRGLAKLD